MQKSDDSTQAAHTGTARPRGRPRAFDRQAALAQATRLFWLKGYEATSISDLTAAMGIGSPSLYAAFGSKDALYAEALDHYGQCYEPLVWTRFARCATARDAVEAMLMDSAAFLTGSLADHPRGCMATLSSVCSDGHQELDEHVRAARAVTFERLKARLRLGVKDGEIPASTDIRALARYFQSVQNGMSLLARDDASRTELEAVARFAMLGWDDRIHSHGTGKAAGKPRKAASHPA